MNRQLLSGDTLDCIRELALGQIRLMDELEAALEANDTPRVLEIARQLVGIEKEVREVAL